MNGPMSRGFTWIRRVPLRESFIYFIHDNGYWFAEDDENATCSTSRLDLLRGKKGPWWGMGRDICSTLKEQQYWMNMTVFETLVGSWERRMRARTASSWWECYTAYLTHGTEYLLTQPYFLAVNHTSGQLPSHCRQCSFSTWHIFYLGHSPDHDHIHGDLQWSHLESRSTSQVALRKTISSSNHNI